MSASKKKKFPHTLMLLRLPFPFAISLSLSLSDSLRPSAHSLCCLYGGGASWGSVGLTGHEHVRGNGKRMEKK